MSPTADSNVQLPDWRQGTDRQRGRRLFQYLQKTDQAPKVLRRFKGQLQPMNRLSEMLNPDLVATFFKHSAVRNGKPSAREIDATLETALRLAANGEFVAAGAVYFLVRSRLSMQAQSEIVRERRHYYARRARIKKTFAASEKAIRISRFIAASKSKRAISSEEIGKKLKIPASTVRRLRNMKKNN